MRDNDIKEKLNRAMEHQVPDVLDNILEQCDKVKGDTIMTVNRNEKRIKSVYKIAVAMAAMLVLLVGVAGLVQWNSLGRVETVVALDVNPSIEIEANKKDRVLDVRALNDDAAIVLEGMDLKNVDLNVAVNAIIGSMLKNGYLSVDQNSILVSVLNSDTDKAAKLQENISAEISAILNASQIDASIMTQEFISDATLEEIAEENQISTAKAKLISRVIAAGLTDINGEAYTYDRLAGLTVNELRVLLESKEVKLEDVQSLGSASETSYIGKENAIEIAYANAAVQAESVKDMEVDMDYEQGRMLYEIEFRTDDCEYEYEIDAQTGEILKAKKDIKDSHDKDVVPEDTEDEDSEDAEIKNTVSVIGKSAARQLALEDAKVTEDKVRDYECDVKKDGSTYIYKISFEADETEYTYKIDAYTGDILDVKTESDENNHDTTVEETENAGADGQERIGKENALNIALTDAGITKKEAHDLDCELDMDNNVYKYKIEFETENTSYEYEIDAYTGEILNVKKEQE